MKMGGGKNNKKKKGGRTRGKNLRNGQRLR